LYIIRSYSLSIKIASTQLRILPLYVIEVHCQRWVLANGMVYQ
jgi:hypothetical protein